LPIDLLGDRTLLVDRQSRQVARHDPGQTFLMVRQTEVPLGAGLVENAVDGSDRFLQLSRGALGRRRHRRVCDARSSINGARQDDRSCRRAGRQRGRRYAAPSMCSWTMSPARTARMPRLVHW
jgi:hypothetical protein